ncbi:MAG: hypothetical protein DRQ44_11650, partial [Gammaproteobacteria bacterium]
MVKTYDANKSNKKILLKKLKEDVRMFIYTLPLRKVNFLAFAAVMLFASTLFTSVDVAAGDIDIDRARWSSDRDRLTVRGDNARDHGTVTIRYGEKEDNGAIIGTTQADGDGDWEFRISGIDPVPCDVTAEDSRDDDDKEVRRAPRNCSNDGGQPPPANTPPTANANGPYSGTTGNNVSFSSAGSSDSDGNIVAYNWNFGDGSSSNNANPNHAYVAAGTYNVSLTVTDNDGATDSDSTTASISDQPPGNIAPTANANGPYSGTTGNNVSFSSVGSNDPDGNIVAYNWSFGDGSSSNNANPTHAYAAAGTYNVSLTVTDNDGATGSDSTSATITNNQPQPIPNISINSTSVNGAPGAPVSEQPFTGQSNYVLFSINDLGMHCGDFDTRISSVLPPFQVMHTQVIRRSGDPDILTPADGVEVIYSASSNPDDPILSGINSAGSGPVLSSMNQSGSVYKTNFWDGAREAYDPFYPSGILPLFYPAGPVANILDLGLPMPNVERFYLGDGFLAAEQQEMPGRFGPYAINDPKVAKTFATDQPFFINLPFGYISAEVNWFESAGIPLTAFDDFGRENPWPLMRVQANVGGQAVASLDTVLPISGEANCGFCHGDSRDGGNGAATQALTDAGIAVASSIDDPLFDDGDPGDVPLEVSKEYAADLNLIRLHDLKHGSGLGANAKYTPDLVDQTPVVCQSCHYTPALDLAQFGPLGPENDNVDPIVLNGGAIIIDSLANGRDQIKNKSMSNVMHSHHATVTGLDGVALFPAMPPPVNPDGSLRDPAEGRQVMEATCYQCHPGRRTDCLRGAMASGGMLCQDCHGDMAQVGDDFTHNVSLPDNIGNFDLGPDFYTNPDTPRVPWANEPGCGSCHTGDAMDNMHGDADTIGDPQDGIRLMQAYLTTDAKATPIVPTNKRFAENVVTAADLGPNGDTGAIGNPMLYRVSTGHEGVFCEACHGATHGIWPNGNPNANDNVASMQLQGHTGTVSECSTCHT